MADEVRSPMPWLARILFALAAGALPAAAAAQDPGEPTLDLFAPGMVAPKLDLQPGPPDPTLAAPVPYAPSLDGTLAVPLPQEEHELVLEARLVADGPPIAGG